MRQKHWAPACGTERPSPIRLQSPPESRRDLRALFGRTISEDGGALHAGGDAEISGVPMFPRNSETIIETCAVSMFMSPPKLSGANISRRERAHSLSSCESLPTLRSCTTQTPAADGITNRRRPRYSVWGCVTASAPEGASGVPPPRVDREAERQLTRPVHRPIDDERRLLRHELADEGGAGIRTPHAGHAGEPVDGEVTPAVVVMPAVLRGAGAAMAAASAPTMSAHCAPV